MSDDQIGHLLRQLADLRERLHKLEHERERIDVHIAETRSAMLTIAEKLGIPASTIALSDDAEARQVSSVETEGAPFTDRLVAHLRSDA